jgi:hypothetical protein
MLRLAPATRLQQPPAATAIIRINTGLKKTAEPVCGPGSAGITKNYVTLFGEAFCRGILLREKS